MNIPSALSVAQITLYLAAVAALVSALITQFVQPLVNRVPALAPGVPDQTLRTLVLRAANLVLSVLGVLGLAAVANQLSLTNLIPTAAAVVMVTLGAHGFYKLIPSPVTSSTPALPGAATVALPTVTLGAPLNGGVFVATKDGPMPAVATPPLPVAGLSAAPLGYAPPHDGNMTAVVPLAIGGPQNDAKQPS